MNREGAAKYFKDVFEINRPTSQPYGIAVPPEIGQKSDLAQHIEHDRDTLYIPERFYKTIALHIAKNTMRKTKNVPLILGIQGPPGEGKTFQCDHILERCLHLKVFRISSGELENEKAGKPAELIRKTYLNAGKFIKENEGNNSVLLINDIDTGLGNWGDSVQYTINTQILYGELMHLTDYPTFIEGEKTNRIPIIITGNDFTKLYAPLLRTGRMTLFTWIPTHEEKCKIISNIYPKMSYNDISNLLDQFEILIKAMKSEKMDNISVSFFSHLKSTFLDDYLWEEMKSLGVYKSIIRISSGYDPYLEFNVNYNDILQKGQELIKSRQLLNYSGGK